MRSTNFLLEAEPDPRVEWCSGTMKKQPRELASLLLALTAGTIVLLHTGCAGGTPQTPSDTAGVKALGLPEERHLQNMRQLTFAGENAEAYFSSDDRWLIYQGHEGDDTCDQIYIMDTNGGNRRLVSTG